jgi:hypothetical protein
MENGGLIGYLILGGTGSSPYNPLPSFDHFYSLPFYLTLFFNEKCTKFSWVPGVY